jgi:hypothetical protein
MSVIAFHEKAGRCQVGIPSVYVNNLPSFPTAISAHARALGDEWLRLVLSFLVVITIARCGLLKLRGVSRVFGELREFRWPDFHSVSL